MDLAMHQPAGAAPAPTKPEEAFHFTGSGSEYFRIWAVNSLLTILTLGIYSAWAKVRRNRYFYANTRLAGASFDYHGNPIAILKGRLIAVALLFCYKFAATTSPRLALALLALGGAAMPWLLWKSLQFRLYNSSYRGIRFGFRGSAGGAYRAFLLWPVLALLTGYLLAPLAHQRIKRFQHNESRFGASRFAFDAGALGFYRVYLVGFGLMLLVLLPMGYAFTTLLAGPRHGAPNPGALALLVFGFYGALFALFPVFTALMDRLIWNHTRLDGHRIACRPSAARMAWIGLTNVLGVVITLGLFIPFARVRMTKYRIESMALLPDGSLDHFLASAQADASAFGEGMADLMDFDLSL
jgi:uncharacterized membrane protein YjgN (DUF898 family)